MVKNSSEKLQICHTFGILQKEKKNPNGIDASDLDISWRFMFSFEVSYSKTRANLEEFQ